MISRALRISLPVMGGYVAIGIPAGILEAQMGFTPWMALMVSATFYTGAGQFMWSNLWLAAQPVLSIIASIAFVNLRQILYAVSFAPRFKGRPLGESLFFSAFVTDESFGVNTEMYATDPSWKGSDAIAVNLFCMSSWAIANMMGAAIGSVVPIPTDLAAFAMTAIFLCLLFNQPFTRTTVVVAGVSAVACCLFKVFGLSEPAIFGGAVIGVISGMLLEALSGDDGSDRGTRETENAVEALGSDGDGSAP